jgi:hypothetical protein
VSVRTDLPGAPGSPKRFETLGQPGRFPREERGEKDPREEVGEKRCRKCGEEKSASAFPRNRRLIDGLSSWCRECHNAATRRWRDENPEKVAEANERRRVVPSVVWVRDKGYVPNDSPRPKSKVY